MANTVFKIKRSSVPGKVPLSTELEIGELAINLADELLFSKNTSNTVFAIGGSTSNTSLETILLTLFSFPSGDYELISESMISEFGENITVEYDLKTTFPSGSGVLVQDLGVLV